VTPKMHCIPHQRILWYLDAAEADVRRDDFHLTRSDQDAIRAAIDRLRQEIDSRYARNEEKA